MKSVLAILCIYCLFTLPNLSYAYEGSPLVIGGEGVKQQKKRLKVSNELSETLGKEFVTLFTEIKQTEHDAYQNVISAWEREHLLLNV